MQSSARPIPPSDHFDGRVFFSPGAPPLPSFKDIVRWQRERAATKWPRWIDIPETRTLPAVPPGAVCATWVNHSTVLIRTEGISLLTDPLYSRACGPFGRFGPRRVHAPGVPFEALPRIDVLLISHDHYDHFDVPTLRRLAKRDQPLAVAPLGNFNLLKRAGFERVVELDWWETLSGTQGARPLPVALQGITATPAQHWSNRLSGPRCGRLWSGFFIRLAGKAVHFVGDTGYNNTYFKDVAARLGPSDLALIPIGAYEPRWFMKGQHCNPAEAVQIHQDLQTKHSIAVHWGTFQLTDEARADPADALRATLAAPRDKNLAPFILLEPGGSLAI